MAYLYIATVFAVLSFVTYGDAIKCWTCSSDLDRECGDTFNHTSPTFILHQALTNCDTQSSPNYALYNNVNKNVCRKSVQTKYGRQIISRSCEWLKSRDEQVGECEVSAFSSPSYNKVDFCETCDTDGCNGAEGQYTSVLWKVLVPAAFALLMLK